MHAGFTFDDAVDIVDYLADLGVSHVYLSPILQAAAGSTHGYDVVDHSRLNAELGGDAGHQRLSEALRRRGMGQIVDIVPNHMAIAESNTWWWDVLENGPSSRWAAAFDIDWDTEGASRQKVLLPILGDHYGRVLEAGDLRLDRDGGSFVIRYFDHVVPVSPRTLDDLLGSTAEIFESDELASLAVAFGRLPPADATDEESVIERHRDKEVLRGQLARLLDENLHLARAIDGAVATTNGDPDALDALIERQNYRLIFWRSAGQELDYRRFFDVPTLIGLRIERRPHLHRRPREGARPGEAGAGRRAAGRPHRRPPLPGRLPPAPAGRVRRALRGGGEDPRARGGPAPDVAGGGNHRLRLPQRGRRPLRRPRGRGAPHPALPGGHRAGPDEPPSWDDVVADGKNLVLREVLGADVNQLLNRLVSVCERHRRYRDYTRRDLHEALWEVLACFPVYRTYVARPGEAPTDADVAVVEAAIAAAADRRPQIDPELFSFLRELLLLRVPGEVEVDFGLRFQQVTGPVMAKGVEDTAFYRFNRLVSLNDVGGDPGRFGTSVDEFHAFNRHMAAEWPHTMLATSTHDTKRSEDVRARIGLLSEIPAEWADTVRRWTPMNARHKTAAADGRPDANAEYLLYQTVVGAFPSTRSGRWRTWRRHRGRPRSTPRGSTPNRPTTTRCGGSWRRSWPTPSSGPIWSSSSDPWSTRDGRCRWPRPSSSSPPRACPISTRAPRCGT